MESPAPEVSRVCLDRREMKVPEVSLDLLAPLVCRLVPFSYLHLVLGRSTLPSETLYGSYKAKSKLCFYGFHYLPVVFINCYQGFRRGLSHNK